MTRPAYLRIAARIKEEWLAPTEARPGSKLPTERQLQAHYGVSRATISRALSTLTAEGLIRTRQGSGAYVAEEPPTSVGGKLVGFIAPHIPQPDLLQDPVLLRVYHGIERRAHELGYQLLTASANYSIAHEEALVERFIRLGAAGLVVYPVYFPEPRRRSEAAADHLARRWRNFPIVLADIGYEEWGRPLVVFDNQGLGYDMTRSLLRNGHRNIAFMGRASDRLHNSVHERSLGWRRALAQAGIAIPPAYEAWPPSALDAAQAAGCQAVEDELAISLLSLSPRPDAVIAYEDGLAMPLIRALQRLGVDVPGEIRVVGFDNHIAGRFFEPAFPTSQPDFGLLGETAMEQLDQLIASPGRRPRTYMLPATTLWRESAALPQRMKGGDALVSV